MSNAAIIEAWQRVVCIPGLSKTIALRHLNEDLGTRYSMSRLGEWRNDKVPMPREVRTYMLESGLIHLLKKHGIAISASKAVSDDIDALAADLA
jgi:hypothetical protein